MPMVDERNQKSIKILWVESGTKVYVFYASSRVLKSIKIVNK